MDQHGSSFRYHLQPRKYDLQLKSETPSPKRIKPTHSTRLKDLKLSIELREPALEASEQEIEVAASDAEQRLQSPHRSSTRSTFEAFTKVHLSSYYWSVPPSPDLERFARHGGPDLSDLRGFTIRFDGPDSIHSWPTSTQQLIGPEIMNPDISGLTGPYDAGFAQLLVENGSYPAFYHVPGSGFAPLPDNWDSIRDRLGQRRPSLSAELCTEDDYTSFVVAQSSAICEAEVIDELLPVLEGNHKAGRCRGRDVLFNNMEDLVESTLKLGKPDVYFGARPEDIHSTIRKDLKHFILPNTRLNRAAAPNLFLELKGPRGIPEVATLQAQHDGSLGARGMFKLWHYGEADTDCSRRASTITGTFQAGTLKLFAVYAFPSPQGRLEYFMHPVAGEYMFGDSTAFRRGLQFYRNARDWAQEERDLAIKAANERVEQASSG